MPEPLSIRELAGVFGRSPTQLWRSTKLPDFPASLGQRHKDSPGMAPNVRDLDKVRGWKARRIASNRICALTREWAWLADLRSSTGALGGGSRPKDWGPLLVAGFLGSFVGGMIFSLIAHEGLKLRPSGLIGSTLGAIVVLLVFKLVQGRGKK